MKMRQKIVPICCLVIIAVFAISLISLKTNTGIFNKNQRADITGDAVNIAESFFQGHDWQQIVTDSQFQLGEKYEVKDRMGHSSYEMYFGTYPNISGFAPTAPMAMNFAWQHLGLEDESIKSMCDFRDEKAGNTQNRAYEDLINKKVAFGYNDGVVYEQQVSLDPDQAVDLVIAPAPSTGVMKWAKEEQVELTVEPVAYDALVFITHQDNPIESLTIEEVQDIYSGKITNWQELGGEDAEIKLFQRDEDSEVQKSMEEKVMQGISMIPPSNLTRISGGGPHAETVSEYKNSKSSIGYTYRLYFDRFYAGQKIKMIPIAGVEPTDENIRSGSYPLSTTYNAVIRSEDQDKVGGKFMQWMLSDDGQACIKQAGYLPLR
ncbi:MAG: PstS family phosphate ABC transporter substrate-binding protein [Bacillota bacterium]|jgi:phosphate transport system substrate-binding protein